MAPPRPPVTARGMRTRAALVAAARRVFERDGYIDARLTDIPPRPTARREPSTPTSPARKRYSTPYSKQSKTKCGIPGLGTTSTRPPRRMP